ncbi:L,D-transpeptidase [Chelativorans sp. Marseille-P2723]|uniref:L,D-transpeptidase n=1 Tax=Chelativorans sp. Marseille-P2723 TaxID=2709133 RepID=UPI00156F962E|nr:L,D-transpeptidase [Chelativorans sp. Marseille-P2723]
MRSKVLFLPVIMAFVTALAGCTPTAMEGRNVFSSDYRAVSDAGYHLPRVPISKVPKKYHRQVVTFETKEKPGTIIVDTREKFLYLILDGGKALRYGIGVGREGFQWSGVAHVAMKREWPTWTPPATMIRRQPELARWAKGMPPGLANPLGPRALYLFQDGRDTLYRLHGTPEWYSIGQATSSGCIRLMNQDIIDLYKRTRIGAKVIVKR